MQSIQWCYFQWPWVTRNYRNHQISAFCVAFPVFVIGEDKDFKFRPESSTTADITSGFSWFPTWLFCQLISPRGLRRSDLAPYRQYQRTTTTTGLVHRLFIASPTAYGWQTTHERGVVMSHDQFWTLGDPVITLEWLKLARQILYTDGVKKYQILL